MAREDIEQAIKAATKKNSYNEKEGMKHAVHSLYDKSIRETQSHKGRQHFYMPGIKK